jgi:hypothetical protein
MNVRVLFSMTPKTSTMDSALGVKRASLQYFLLI